MASTRDINSSANYCLEQKGMETIRNNLMFYNGPNGRAVNPAFPKSYNIGHMPADNLSYNPVDIESSLFGIDSTNLVSPRAPVKPELKTVPTVSFFERQQVIMPNIVCEDNTQRPFIFYGL